MNTLELRKIILIGYAYDTPEGAPMLHGDGLPMRPVECPVRMRFALWIPQPEPHRRREIGTLRDMLQAIVYDHNPSAAFDLKGAPAATLEAYMRDHNLGDLMSERGYRNGFTHVVDAQSFELQALRDGAIEEQLLYVTFPRQPSLEELRKHLMPHWERRTAAALGFVPNQAPVDRDPKPTITFTST